MILIPRLEKVLSGNILNINPSDYRELNPDDLTPEFMREKFMQETNVNVQADWLIIFMSVLLKRFVEIPKEVRFSNIQSIVGIYIWLYQFAEHVIKERLK